MPNKDNVDHENEKFEISSDNENERKGFRK